MRKRDRKEFITDSAHPTGEIGKRSDRVPLHYHAMGNSGIEIGDNEVQSEEIDLDGMVNDPHLGDGEIDPDGDRIRKREKSIIKPRRRVGSSSSEKKWIGAVDYLFSNILKSSLWVPQVLSRALLGAFAIQEGVKTYR